MSRALVKATPDIQQLTAGERRPSSSCHLRLNFGKRGSLAATREQDDWRNQVFVIITSASECFRAEHKQGVSPCCGTHALENEVSRVRALDHATSSSSFFLGYHMTVRTVMTRMFGEKQSREYS